ncbi:MAG: hypothetical protein QNJ98_20445 [Planctomycetota bacterium]|nr:hypothetical protein [Planctomycetota bacterium]
MPTGWRYVYGDLYALPAGMRGVNDSCRLPMVDVDTRDAGYAVLGLPDAGPWDIVLDTPCGMARKTNVRTPVGERTRVTLAWRAMRPLRFRFAPDMPAHTTANLTISDAQNETAYGWPGASAWGEVELRDTIVAGRTLTTWAVPRGRRYHVDARLERGTQVVVPTVVTHGLRTPVVLRVTEAAMLSTEPRVPKTAPAHWRAWRPSFDLRITDAYGRVDTTELEITFEGGKLEVDDDYMQLAPGPVSIAWSGRGVRPGRIDGMELAPGASRTVRPEIAWDPSVAPPPTPRTQRTLRVHGLEHGEVTVAAMLTNRSDERDAWNKDVDVENGALRLADAYARATSVMVFRGMTHASWPVRTTGPRPKPLRLYPAGHLVVVPDVVIAPELGGLRLRRKDGGPMLLCSVDCGELKDASAERELDAEPGAVIGPWPEGEHVFEVWLGLRRLPDATAVVRAGHLDALHVRTQPR